MYILTGIYSSPLIRAYETACLIRGHRNIPIIRDDRLRELCFGEYEGKNFSKLLEDESDPFHYFFKEPDKYVAPDGGESLQHICERAKEFMQEVIEPLIYDGEKNAEHDSEYDKEKGETQNSGNNKEYEIESRQHNDAVDDNDHQNGHTLTDGGLERIMIVAHGALNKAIMCYVKQHGIDQYWSGGLQKNCNVIIVNLDEKGYTVIDETKLFYEA